jgi:hypothetical protein
MVTPEGGCSPACAAQSFCSESSAADGWTRSELAEVLSQFDGTPLTPAVRVSFRGEQEHHWGSR